MPFKVNTHFRTNMRALLTGALLLVLLTAGSTLARASKHTFSISGNNFLLDGKPFQIISGEMNYARIPRAYWPLRFKMAKAMGLNTIAAYVFWNYQEPQKGKFDFKGNHDFAQFVRDAQKAGLWVLLRPSAYACAEWEFGGYPYWLLNEKGMKVRSMDPKFIALMKKYYEKLGKELAPLQITHGGPIIMVQVENEYGSYGDDKAYLKTNEKLLREAGFDVPFYTADGLGLVSRGSVTGALPAIDGSVNIARIKKVVEKYHQGHGPFFISEWYPGWFDSWGKPFNKVPAKDCAPQLDTVLAHGFSISMYMAHGGTTRGFMNGANYSSSSPYSPQTSSYDYDAPINEAGHATHKFYVFRDIIKKYLPPGETLLPVPPPVQTITIPRTKLEYAADILHVLPKPIHSITPLTFEDINQAYGYVLYRTTVRGPQKGELDIVRLRDYGIVFVNGKRVAVLNRMFKQETCSIDLPAGLDTLDIFVENLGRINYGSFINDNHQGITKEVLFNGRRLTVWNIYGFPFISEPRVTSRMNYRTQYPLVRVGSFELKEVGDTYLDMKDWGKGVVWINGHNLGRYWDIGPQQTIYVPAPWLKKGKNQVAVFEELKLKQDEISSINHPILDDLRIGKRQTK